jgi:hypothetical protein
LPEVVRAEADRLPDAQKRWLNRFGGAPLEVMFRRNKDGRLLQMLMATHPGSQHFVLRRTFIPARIQRLGDPMVRIQNRRTKTPRNANRYLHYLAYLSRRTVVNSMANVSFLFHSVTLWLSTRALSSQFWLFLGASFFLTWACRSTSSSSTCS